MKKFLLPACLFFFFIYHSNAQNLTLSDEGGPIIANSIIVQSATPDSSRMVTFVNVTNSGSQAITVKCKKSVLSKMDSTDTSMCWAGGCYPPWVTVSPMSQQIDPGQTVTDFSGDYFSLHTDGLFRSGETVVRWVFFNTEDVNDSVSVTVKYTTYPLGVENKLALQGSLSAPYPNPAREKCTFTYSLPQESEGIFTIRNLVGSAVHSEVLGNSAGKIDPDLSSFADGIYFCSLVINGKSAITRKLVISH
jgi:hypothetical protein